MHQSPFKAQQEDLAGLIIQKTLALLSLWSPSYWKSMDLADRKKHHLSPLHLLAFSAQMDSLREEPPLVIIWLYLRDKSKFVISAESSSKSWVLMQESIRMLTEPTGCQGHTLLIQYLSEGGRQEITWVFPCFFKEYSHTPAYVSKIKQEQTKNQSQHKQTQPKPQSKQTKNQKSPNQPTNTAPHKKTKPKRKH